MIHAIPEIPIKNQIPNAIGIFEIIKNGRSTGKYCNTQQKVEKKIKWKQRWWNIREAVFMCIKKVLFRFPYVLIVNIIFVVGIIYLYKQL